MEPAEHPGELVAQERLQLRRDPEIAHLNACAHRRRPQPQLAVDQLQDRLAVDRRRVAQPAARSDAASSELEGRLALGFANPPHGRRMPHGDPRLLGGHPDRVVARARLRQRAVDAGRPGVEGRRERQRLRQEPRVGSPLAVPDSLRRPSCTPSRMGRPGVCQGQMRPSASTVGQSISRCEISASHR